MDIVMTFSPLAGLMVACFGAFLFLRSQRPDNRAYKWGAALAVLTSFLLLWTSLAVGILGSTDPFETVPALLMGAVIAVVGRFRPPAMALALFVAAGMQALVGFGSVVLQVASPEYWRRELVFNGAFVTLFACAGLLFRRSARFERDEGSPAEP